MKREEEIKREEEKKRNDKDDGTIIGKTHEVQVTHTSEAQCGIKRRKNKQI
jgi:hypothetical protein